jgi:sigma-B regulation protein RsbU (phosphoserine phosphatase)
VEQEGYFVFVVAQAGEALERLRKERFDLLLLDVAGAGAEFVEALRRDSHLANVPIIVISAVDDVDAIERCLALGADDCLPSKFGPAMLRARVNAALDRRGQLDNQNLRREMDVARNIQRDFLPESLPTVQGIQLDALLDAARQVSGDFYDAFQLPSGKIVLVVGDVCDKGVGAALFMALFRSLIRASADPVGGGAMQMIGGRHTLVMQAVERATPGDLLTRVAGFTNHYIALIIGADGGIRELRPTGPALGMIADADFTSAEAKLEPGQTLLAFTDGLVEARSPTGEVFGGERLRTVVRGFRTTAAPDLIRDLWAALKAFARQAEPHDDLTMLAATRETIR